MTVYSHEHSNDNPFHVRELTEPEFRALLGSSFGHVAVLRQNVAVGSLIVGPVVAEFDKRAFPAGQQGPPVDSATAGRVRRPVHRLRSELADAQRRAQRAEVLAGWQQELAGEADRRAAEQPSSKRRSGGAGVARGAVGHRGAADLAAPRADRAATGGAGSLGVIRRQRNLVAWPYSDATRPAW